MSDQGYAASLHGTAGFLPILSEKGGKMTKRKRNLRNLTWIILALQIFCVACKPVEKLPKASGSATTPEQSSDPFGINTSLATLPPDGAGSSEDTSFPTSTLETPSGSGETTIQSSVTWPDSGQATSHTATPVPITTPAPSHPAITRSQTTPPVTTVPVTTTKRPATTAITTAATQPPSTTPAVSYIKQNIKVPAQPGTNTQTNAYATVDYSYAAEGYISVQYNQNTTKRVKVRVAMGDKNMTYDLLLRQRYEVFPLTYGSGTYKITVYEQVEGTSYAVALATEIQVTLRNSLVPYVTPTQTVYFTSSSNVVAKAGEIAKNSTSDFEVLNKVYTWITENIQYDHNRAADVLEGRLTLYIPSPDATLASKKGICYDYASFMAAMLRSYRIPTRLVKGYVSRGGKPGYHAWVEVYCETGGTLPGGLAVKAGTWTRIDATYGAVDLTYHTKGYQYTTSSIE